MICQLISISQTTTTPTTQRVQSDTQCEREMESVRNVPVACGAKRAAHAVVTISGTSSLLCISWPRVAVRLGVLGTWGIWCRSELTERIWCASFAPAAAAAAAAYCAKYTKGYANVRARRSNASRPAPLQLSQWVAQAGRFCVCLNTRTRTRPFARSPVPPNPSLWYVRCIKVS